MSNRKLRTITISAWLHHDSTGVATRARRRVAPKTSTHHVHAFRRRKREGVRPFRVELPLRKLRLVLEAAGHLEGADYRDDHFVAEALQIWLEELLTYGMK
jgi:hypothetical protein